MAFVCRDDEAFQEPMDLPDCAGPEDGVQSQQGNWDQLSTSGCQNPTEGWYAQLAGSMLGSIVYIRGFEVSQQSAEEGRKKKP